MTTKTDLALLLTVMLLADSINGLKWQGTGSGMNSTVLSEIWTGLEANLNTALNANRQSGYDSFTRDISDRLTNRWDKAWNVVLVKSQAKYDTVLYGYAFNNQWMWFNGVPNSILTPAFGATLIVWKDYNCQNWISIASGESNGFTQSQKVMIQNEVAYSTSLQGYQNDIWQTASTLMISIVGQQEFSFGAYSVILSQDPNANFYGRVCRVGNQFYKMQNMHTSQMEVSAGEFVTYVYGAMYFFTTSLIAQ